MSMINYELELLQTERQEEEQIFELDNSEIQQLEQDFLWKNQKDNLGQRKWNEIRNEYQNWERIKLNQSGAQKDNDIHENYQEISDNSNLRVFFQYPKFLTKSQENKQHSIRNELFKQNNKFQTYSQRGSLILKQQKESQSQIQRLNEIISKQKEQYQKNNEDYLLKEINDQEVKENEIKTQRETLPIHQIKNQLISVVNNNKVTILVGETGSGKTTQLCQFLYQEKYGNFGLIGCTQPWRIAATSIAKRVSEEMNTQLGDLVGYSIRFESECSEKTKIKFMTDGVLLREAIIDPYLSKYSVIIMDEAHERSLNTDILLGLLKKIVYLRTDIKIVITSATMNAEKFSFFFQEAPIVSIEGWAYPVETIYCGLGDDYLENATWQVVKIHSNEDPGDILVFLTGQEDIEFFCVYLKGFLEKFTHLSPLVILPLYSLMSPEKQRLVFRNYSNRKCIVSTNIAETSITLTGIKYVVDSGLSKVKYFDSNLGLDGLQMWPISKASANQRAGRAGRTAPGKCFRLYGSDDYQNHMEQETVPEIKRTNLSNVILLLKRLGYSDVNSFNFLDKPNESLIQGSLFQLWTLGAIDDSEQLTDLGWMMSEFPLDPSQSWVIIEGIKLGCVLEVLQIMSVLNVPSIFNRPKEKEVQADKQRALFSILDSDHLTLLNVFQQYQKTSNWFAFCEQNFLNIKQLQKVESVLSQLKSILKDLDINITTSDNKELIRKAICSGYAGNAVRIKHTGEYKQLRNGLTCFIHPSSSIYIMGSCPEYLIYNDMVMTSKPFIHCVSSVKTEWLLEYGYMFYKDPNQNNQQQGKQESLEKIVPDKIKQQIEICFINPNLIRLKKKINKQK